MGTNGCGMLCVPHHSAQGVNVFMNFCHGGYAELANALLDAHPEIDINQRTDDVSEGEGERSTHTHHCNSPPYPSTVFDHATKWGPVHVLE